MHSRTRVLYVSLSAEKGLNINCQPLFEPFKFNTQMSDTVYSTMKQTAMSNGILLTTRNARQSLAYNPLGVIVSPPSCRPIANTNETLTY